MDDSSSTRRRRRPRWAGGALLLAAALPCGCGSAPQRPDAEPARASVVLARLLSFEDVLLASSGIELDDATQLVTTSSE